MSKKLRTAEELKRHLLNHRYVDDKGCWNWILCKDREGYGVTSFQRKNMRVHRLAYLLFADAPISGTLILHKCDNPGCFNPDHLFRGMQKDNIRDRDLKGRGVKGEDNATAKLTNGDVRIIRLLREAGIRIRDIADSFKITEASIYNLLRSATYGSVR